MKDLKEIRFDKSKIILKDNLVRSGILPETAAELDRCIDITGDAIVEGAVFAKRIAISGGEIEMYGAVYAQHEIYADSDAQGSIIFKKAVASADAITSRSPKFNLTFCSDVNAKTVALTNAYVAGSIYADEVMLDNCVVIGGVFSTQKISLANSIVGTFNTPEIKISGKIGTLLPSAFSIEKIMAAPGATMYNYSLADFGSLFRGLPQDPNSGKIRIDIDNDEVRTQLSDGEVQKQLRTYTVVGKVLAADLLDTEKFQNHFLLTAASLGPQLLRVYDLGEGSELTQENIRKFFVDVLSGRIDVQDMNAKFDISEIAARLAK